MQWISEGKRKKQAQRDMETDDQKKNGISTGIEEDK